ncbi:probable methyltransferase PMT2 [Vigna angularis]|nr:probable methyltransferase PMT2 [Vigna angularis]
MKFPRENMAYRERHCFLDEDKLCCLIPAPRGYATPFPWPMSRDYVPYANAPYKSLTVEKAVQNWIQYEGNVIAMSIAPRDSHEAQVQFALERGVPAIIGVLGTIMLSFPSRAFDMAHCSRCLILWGSNDGIYMKAVDRVLRPGGYWVLSGPPINWKMQFRAWQRPEYELEEEQRKIEEIAKLLCWEKKYEKGETAI